MFPLFKLKKLVSRGQNSSKCQHFGYVRSKFWSIKMKNDQNLCFLRTNLDVGVVQVKHFGF